MQKTLAFSSCLTKFVVKKVTFFCSSPSLHYLCSQKRKNKRMRKQVTTLFYIAAVFSVVIYTGCTASKQTSLQKKENIIVSSPQIAQLPSTAVDEPVAVKFTPIPFESPAETLAMFKPFQFSEYDKANVRARNHNPFYEADTLYIAFNDYCMPLPGAKVISQYMTASRRNHTGIDLKTFASDTVRAAFAGQVRMSQPYSSYGNVVVIRHYNGLETVYSHNVKNLVNPGEFVLPGDAIALVGRTGRATTEHVHFEVRIMGEHIDPNKIFDFAAQRPAEKGFYLIKRNNGYVLHKPGEMQTTPDAAPTVYYSHSERRSQPSDTANVSASEYTVKQGDTLYSISRRFGITLNHLCIINNITTEQTLKIGKVLKVK